MKQNKAEAKRSRTTRNPCGMNSSVPTAWGNLLLEDNVPMLIRWSLSLPIRHSANSPDKHFLSYCSSRTASSSREAALLPLWATLQYYCSLAPSTALEVLSTPVVLSSNRPAVPCCQASKLWHLSCPFKKNYTILQSTDCWKAVYCFPAG